MSKNEKKFEKSGSIFSLLSIIFSVVFVLAGAYFYFKTDGNTSCNNNIKSSAYAWQTFIKTVEETDDLCNAEALNALNNAQKNLKLALQNCKNPDEKNLDYDEILEQYKQKNESYFALKKSCNNDKNVSKNL